MESIEFDFEKIAQMKLDNAIVDGLMGISSEAFGGRKDVVLIFDKLIRSLVNKGIPLPMALHVVIDFCGILTEKGGENHG